MLRAHVNANGTAPDGRLFQGTRGGPLSESVYGRAWHAARALALGPELAASGHDDLLNQQIGRVPGPPEGRGPCPSVKKPTVAPTARLGGKTSGCTNRDERGRRPPCVRDFPARPADSPQITPTAAIPAALSTSVWPAQSQILKRQPAIRPGPQTVREPLAPARKSRCHHPIAPALTCGNGVAGVGFEPT